MAEILRVYKQNNFTVMSNHHLQNQNLSLKAIGLLSKLLSLPDDWNISIRGMAKICKDGYDSIRTAFQELIAEGYVIRKTLRDTCGKLNGVAYIVRENPSVLIPDEFFSEQKPREEIATPNTEESDQEKKKEVKEESLENKGIEPHGENPFTVNAITEEPYRENPTTGNPTTEKPTTGKPSTENPCGQNTNIINKTKRINTKEQNKKELDTPPPPSGKVTADTEENIKTQIGYLSLLADNDRINLDAVVRILVRYRSGQGQYAYIDGNKVRAADIQERFKQLRREDIEQVLCSVTNTEVKNMQSYLIAALYRTVQRSSGGRREQPRQKENRFNNFHQREYDYVELEKELLNRT